MERRVFLERTVVATILVANGRVWRAFAQQAQEYGTGPGFLPWTTWRDADAKGPLAFVAAAILASNAFNSQPWIFKVQESGIEVYADTRRNLGAFDPYLRELHISIGCALENLALAARAAGFEPSVTIAPGELEPPSSMARELVARVELTRGPRAASELYDAIPHRHTNRQPFDRARPLPDRFLGALGAASAEEKDVKLFLFASEPQRKALVDAIIDSAAMMADPDVQRGTRPWLHPSMEEWQRTRDGSYAGPAPGSATASLEQYAALMSSAPLFGVIAVCDRYDRAQAVRAGRVWQRAHLLATARGAAARPANGAVEIIDHERRLQHPPATMRRLARIIGDESWQPTFMFYMGYATVAAVASVRRGVEEVLL